MNDLKSKFVYNIVFKKSKNIDVLKLVVEVCENILIFKICWYMYNDMLWKIFNIKDDYYMYFF